MERPPLLHTPACSPDDSPRREGERALFEQLHIKEQWGSQIRILRKNGFLSIIPETHDFGYKDAERNIYPVPTWQEIEKWLNNPEQNEFLQKKAEQGFTRLLLVPEKFPLDNFIKNYEETIASHRKEGTLFLSDGAKVTEPPYEGKEVYVWDEYKNADNNGKLMYAPREFTANHGAVTKSSITEGWRVILTENLPNLPKEGQGKTKGGRKQLETNQTPREYLKLLQTDPEYKGERGYTPEDYIIDVITRLEEKNQTTDDDTYSYLIGAYFPSAGVAPGSFFNRDRRRASLGGSAADDRDDYYGVRVSVGVSKN